MHSVPVYISEIAPASVRGLLVACKEALIVAGMLVGFSASALFIAMVRPKQNTATHTSHADNNIQVSIRLWLYGRST